MQAGKTLLQSIFWRGLYYVSAFIINILIARHFEASVSGSVYYLSSIYAFAVLLSSLSIESGIIYFTAKGDISVNRLFNFSIAWSLFIGLLTFVFVNYILKEIVDGISSTLLVISAVMYISGNLLITYCAGIFYARNDFMLPNVIIITGTIILIILIPYGGKSIVYSVTGTNYFYIYFTTFFVQGICMAIAIKRKYLKKIRIQFLNFVEFRLLFRYCALAFLGNIVFFLLYRIDYFFVERYTTAVELGNYIQVSKLVHLFFILPTILATVVFPFTASGQKAEIDKFLTLLSRALFMLYIFACLILGLIGSWLFPFVFGKSFTGMYQPFLFLIPGILSLSGIFTLTAYYAGINRIKVNITGSLYALMVILAGNIIFVPKYGISAAALVSSVGYVVYQIYIIMIFKKEYPGSALDFFIFRSADWIKIKNSILVSINSKNESQQ